MINWLQSAPNPKFLPHRVVETMRNSCVYLALQQSELSADRDILFALLSTMIAWSRCPCPISEGSQFNPVPKSLFTTSPITPPYGWVTDLCVHLSKVEWSYLKSVSQSSITTHSKPSQKLPCNIHVMHEREIFCIAMCSFSRYLPTLWQLHSVSRNYPESTQFKWAAYRHTDLEKQGARTGLHSSRLSACCFRLLRLLLSSLIACSTAAAASVSACCFFMNAGA